MIRGVGGFAYLELVVALLLGAMVLAGLQGVTRTTLNSAAATRARAQRVDDAQFALDRTAVAAAAAFTLILPQADAPATAVAENHRVSTWPPATGDNGAVLAVSLDPALDRDGDGHADADNDHDGRVDEDWGADATADQAAGVRGVDDDADGVADESSASDDDESGSALAPQPDEDSRNGVDDDNDGRIDEDSSADTNGDAGAGVSGVDDDGDGTVDEGSAADDDEDGRVDEDGPDPVVFQLRDDRLVMRTPVPWDVDGNGVVDALDVAETTLLEGVSRFGVERLAVIESRCPTVELSLTLAPTPTSPALSVTRTVRVGCRP